MESIWKKYQIKRAREEKGLSVKDAANLLDITPEYLSMLENGHRSASQKLISKMCAEYGKTVEFFLNDEKKLVVA